MNMPLGLVRSQHINHALCALQIVAAQDLSHDKVRFVAEDEGTTRFGSAGACVRPPTWASLFKGRHVLGFKGTFCCVPAGTKRHPKDRVASLDQGMRSPAAQCMFELGVVVQDLPSQILPFWLLAVPFT